jgi:hypothetical protein
MGHTPPVVGGSSASSSAATEKIPNPIENLPLQEVHRDFVTALAKEVPTSSSDVPATDNNESFRKFLDTLTKNGSDKIFMHQKKYQKVMEPIIEEQEVPVPGQQGGENDNMDMVDYGSRVMKKQGNLFKGSSWG